MVRLNEFKLRFKLTGRMSICRNCNNGPGLCPHRCLIGTASASVYGSFAGVLRLETCDLFDDDGALDMFEYGNVEWFV